MVMERPLTDGDNAASGWQAAVHGGTLAAVLHPLRPTCHMAEATARDPAPATLVDAALEAMA